MRRMQLKKLNITVFMNTPLSGREIGFCQFKHTLTKTSNKSNVVEIIESWCLSANNLWCGSPFLPLPHPPFCKSSTSISLAVSRLEHVFAKINFTIYVDYIFKCSRVGKENLSCVVVWENLSDLHMLYLTIWFRVYLVKENLIKNEKREKMPE